MYMLVEMCVYTAPRGFELQEELQVDTVFYVRNACIPQIKVNERASNGLLPL